MNILLYFSICILIFSDLGLLRIQKSANQRLSVKGVNLPTYLLNISAAFEALTLFVSSSSHHKKSENYKNFGPRNQDRQFAIKNRQENDATYKYLSMSYTSGGMFERFFYDTVVGSPTL